MDIGFAREAGMLFELRADGIDGCIRYGVDKINRVWVAHRDGSHGHIVPVDFESFADGRTIWTGHRDLWAAEACRTHVDADAVNDRSIAVQLKHKVAGLCLDGYRTLVRVAIFIDPFAKAADTVTAHFCLGAIRVVHTVDKVDAIPG